jgi:hypothetical protein
MNGATARLAVATIAPSSYLPFARVLGESLRRHHPELPFFVLVPDRPPSAGEGVEHGSVLALDDLEIPDLPRFRFGYTPHQMAVAVKPYLLGRILRRGFEGVLFLDSDTLVLGDLAPLLERVARHAAVVTPHLTAPLVGADRVERELVILRAGIYNLGVLGVSAGAGDLLAWWQQRLYRHCRCALDLGLHYDQRWFDLVPGMFADVHILRDPGYNVGHWDLPERGLDLVEGEWRVRGAPCRLFHFSGFSPDHAAVVTRHSPRLTMAGLGPAARLFDRYARALSAAGWGAAGGASEEREQFDNGVAIPEIVRRIYLDLSGAERFGDPFATAAAGSYFRWLLEACPSARKPARKVSRLWEAVHRQRPDLQRAFPEPLGADGAAFLAWTRRHGTVEYGIPPALRNCAD